MKFSILSIRIFIVLLGMIALAALSLHPKSYIVGKIVFFVVILAIILWVAGNVIKRKSPSTYLQKVAIYIGLWLSASSFFNFSAAYYGQKIDISVAQIIGGFIGGILIMILGYKKK